MIKIISMSYPPFISDRSAQRAHVDIPLESLTEWFEAPAGLHFAHVDVDDAIDYLDLEHDVPTALGAAVLNAIEIHMGRDNTYIGYDERAIHVATIFFVNDDEFRICTRMRSNDALERILELGAIYIAKLACWMRDPVEADESLFLTATEGKINIEGPAPHALTATVRSAGASA